MKRVLRAFVLASAALLFGAVAIPAPARATPRVSLSFFYDSLAPYGDWIASAQFGYVWRPARVGRGWRPYSDGRWVDTNLGLTFVSDDPWSWAAYHYGRWYFDPIDGWVWVPGTEWAPAWVAFEQGDGWIGWAPLPPRVSLALVASGRYRIDPGAYCFVDEPHFFSSHVAGHMVPVARNGALLRATVNVTRFSRSHGRIVDRSVALDRVIRASSSRPERLRVMDVPDRRAAPKAFVQGDHVAFFRPRVGAERTHAPKTFLAARPPHPTGVRGTERGASTSRGRASRAKAKRSGPLPHGL